MKKIPAEMEENPFTSSLNLCPEACCIHKELGAGGVTPPLTPYFQELKERDSIPLLLEGKKKF